MNAGHPGLSACLAEAPFVLEAIAPTTARTETARLEKVEGLVNPFSEKTLFKQLQVGRFVHREKKQPLPCGQLPQGVTILYTGDLF